MTALHEVRAELSGTPRRVAILLTNAGGQVSLVSDLRNVGAALGLKVRVIACDRRPRSRPACLMADAAYETGDPDDPAYIDSIIEICVVHRVRLIIPTNAAEMLVLSRNRDRFHAIGVGIAGSGPDLVALSGDPERVEQLAGELVKDRKFCSEPAGDRERRFEVLMYFDLDGRLQTIVPCERLDVEGGEHLVTRRCPELEALAADMAGHLEEPRSVVCFDARLTSGEPIKIDKLRTHLGETFEIAQRAGAQLIRWMLSEHCLGQGAGGGEWREGVEMFRYQASMFVLPH
jgi:carbamoyl-phosphate synthase large subunit